MKRTIGIVTVARSDYGLYYPILKAIKTNPDFSLQIHVSGMHLEKNFGSTYQEIERDGFKIATKVPMSVNSDQPRGIAAAMGKGTIGFANVFAKYRPDILLILGDRFEMHCAAVAAIPFRIPLAHIHGGELTYGAFDDYFRHSLTKFSHLHFATTKVYAKRIVQMGEEPWRVVVSGAPGVDNAVNVPVFSDVELGKKFGLKFDKPIILVTYHPVTNEYQDTRMHIGNLLSALKKFNSFQIVFTYPNSDTNREIIINQIEKFSKNQSNVSIVKNFGFRGYVSMMAKSAVMVGNSSSGIIEAASFKLPVVNIGSRQDGRLRSANVIDVGYATNDVVGGITKAISPVLKQQLNRLVNIYGDGRAAERIVKTLAKADLAKLLNKKFHDL